MVREIVLLTGVSTNMIAENRNRRRGSPATSPTLWIPQRAPQRACSASNAQRSAAKAATMMTPMNTIPL